MKSFEDIYQECLKESALTAIQGSAFAPNVRGAKFGANDLSHPTGPMHKGPNKAMNRGPVNLPKDLKPVDGGSPRGEFTPDNNLCMTCFGDKSGGPGGCQC